MSSCKKKNISPESKLVTCTEDKHFEGKYVGNNTYQHDTIEIVFTGMTNCKSTYIIKGFAKPYNVTTSNCSNISNQDYQIVDNKVLITNSTIIDNVWSNNGITNDNDISIYACNNNQLNFKKIN